MRYKNMRGFILVKQRAKSIIIICGALLFVGCWNIGAPRTDKYVMDERQIEQSSFPVPDFRVISFPPQKIIKVNFYITDSLAQMLDSIRVNSKHYTYPLVFEKSEKRKDTTDYYYFKDLKMGDLKWYLRNNAEKITLKMYKKQDSAVYVFQRVKY